MNRIPIVVAAPALVGTEALAQKLPQACPGGGILTVATEAPFAGYAFDLIKQAPFLVRHAALVRGEARWVVDLMGPSSPNRVYLPLEGQPVLVFESCKPRDCGDNPLYGALQGEGYGLVLFEQGRRRMVGDASGALGAAITTGAAGGACHAETSGCEPVPEGACQDDTGGGVTVTRRARQDDTGGDATVPPGGCQDGTRRAEPGCRQTGYPKVADRRKRLLRSTQSCLPPGSRRATPVGIHALSQGIKVLIHDRNLLRRTRFHKSVDVDAGDVGGLTDRDPMFAEQDQAVMEPQRPLDLVFVQKTGVVIGEINGDLHGGLAFVYRCAAQKYYISFNC